MNFFCKSCAGTGYQDYPSCKKPCPIPGHTERHHGEVRRIAALLQRGREPFVRSDSGENEAMDEAINLRAVSEWMTEDVAWMELLDLEIAGFDYNLEEKMINIERCKDCGGYRMVTRPMETGPADGTADDCSSRPCICPDEEKDIEEAVKEYDRICRSRIDMGDYEYDPVAKIRFMKPNNLEKMIGEYASYGKQEIRFCPYCGAALGML